MRGEQNNILFPVRISWANNFPNLSPFAPPLGLEPLQATAPKLAAQNQFLGRRPKPALLFLIAEKEGKKASPLGTYKTYFEPGVLQLPTVGQIKRLYNSVQNRFYKQVQKGALNNKGNGNNS